jgi:hypothetical protein
MEKQQLESLLANQTENNKQLLKHVLEPMLDEMAFSESGLITLKHGGLTGEYVDYEKALTLLKKNGVVSDFKNVRGSKPVIDGTIYVRDSFEIKYVAKDLLAFSNLLFNRNAPKPIVHSDLKNQAFVVEPRSYDPANGVLHIAGYSIQIIKQSNQKGTQHESKQARLMRYLFKDVNSLRDGVPMRKILSVRTYDFKPKHRKLVKSYVSEINKKIPQELLIKELVLTSQHSVMLDIRYLK